MNPGRPDGFFITGTDTGVGKTWVTATLMHFAKQRGISVLGMKPVASGCEVKDGQLINEDALILQSQASIPIAYSAINPYAFPAPVSPHIAAGQVDCSISLEKITECFNRLRIQADLVFVEGVGGWEAPLSSDLTVADMAARLGLPVILTVGLRLGCLNHALLSASAIRYCGAELAGWVGNRIDPELLCANENIDTLKSRLPAACLGILPYSECFDPVSLGQHLPQFVKLIG